MLFNQNNVQAHKNCIFMAVINKYLSYPKKIELLELVQII
jgi:hypothetical protein